MSERLAYAIFTTDAEGRITTEQGRAPLRYTESRPLAGRRVIFTPEDAERSAQWRRCGGREAAARGRALA